MAAQDLATLEQRMRELSHTPHHDESCVKYEDVELDPSRDRCICGECALTFSTTGDLGHHFLHLHLHGSSQGFTCPHDICHAQFSTEISLRDHVKKSHRIQCGHRGCEATFGEGALLAQHEVQHTQRDNQFRARTCPHIGCGQVFADQALLFAHYDGLHPLSIFLPGKKNPYKCPFCPKRYSTERFMPAHQRKDHSSTEGTSGKDTDSQEALIRQSHESMARKASRVSVESGSRANYNLQTQSQRQMNLSNRTITVDGSRVTLRGINSIPELDEESDPDHHASTENLSIGYLLPNGPGISRQTNAAKEDSDDEYPEALALDECELPRNQVRNVHIGDDFNHDDVGQRVIRWILVLLGLQNWLGVSEVLDVWDTFLSADQRVFILQQLHSIDVGNDDVTLLSALHGTVLCEVIHAWAQFKLLTFQIPQEMKESIVSAKTTTLAILRYCQTFETLINEARPIASAQGVELPDLLRQAPADSSVITSEAPFVDLLFALENRVKCRTVHSEWLQFTNELILKEMRRYIEDLKTQAKAIHALSLRPDSWYKAMKVL